MAGNFTRRLDKLERNHPFEETVLILPDGKRVTVPDGLYLSRLYFGQIHGRCVLNQEQEALLELVRQSVDAKEPGGDTTIELLRAIMLSPMTDEFYSGTSGIGQPGISPPRTES